MSGLGCISTPWTTACIDRPTTTTRALFVNINLTAEDLKPPRAIEHVLCRKISHFLECDRAFLSRGDGDWKLYAYSGDRMTRIFLLPPAMQDWINELVEGVSDLPPINFTI